MTLLEKILEILKSFKQQQQQLNLAPANIPFNNKFRDCSGKGMYIYYLDPIYMEEGSIEKSIQWFKDLGINHVWIRIVGKKGWSKTQTKEQAKEFIKQCKENNINVGAWGFIYDPDNNPEKYAHHVVEYVNELELDLFVHNAEHDHEDDSKKVEQEHAKKYWNVINDGLSNITHGLSTYWHVDYHPNFPYDVYMENCDFITPQIYHTVKDPIETIIKGINLNKRFKKPIVPTLQAFWGEMKITEQSATVDFNTICKRWNIDIKDLVDKNNIIGVNIWHAGGKNSTAMNEQMESMYKEFNPILKKL